MTHSKAKNAVKQAWIAGLILSVFTLIGGIFVWSQSVGGEAWFLIDVAIFAGASIGVYFESRIAAIVLLAYLVVSRVVAITVFGLDTTPMQLVFSLVLLFFFVQGVRGTFRLQKKMPGWE